MKIHKIPAADSQINNYVRVDYFDSFEAQTQQNAPSLEQVIKHVFGYSPGWVQFLLRLRGAIVRPFGLKHENINSKKRLYDKLAVGEKLDFFSIVAIDGSCIVLKLKDSHLDAVCCLSVEQMMQNCTVRLTTAVEFHNRLGRCYFALIKPFHRIIIKSSLRRLQDINHHNNKK